VLRAGHSKPCVVLEREHKPTKLAPKFALVTKIMNLQLQCLAESDIDSEVDTLRKDGIDAQVYFLVLSCGISPAEVTLGSIIANFKSA
jgi:hypothetical protein